MRALNLAGTNVAVMTLWRHVNEPRHLQVLVRASRSFRIRSGAMRDTRNQRVRLETPTNPMLKVIDLRIGIPAGSGGGDNTSRVPDTAAVGNGLYDWSRRLSQMVARYRGLGEKRRERIAFLQSGEISGAVRSFIVAGAICIDVNPVIVGHRRASGIGASRSTSRALSGPRLQSQHELARRQMRALALIPVDRPRAFPTTPDAVLECCRLLRRLRASAASMISLPAHDDNLDAAGGARGHRHSTFGG